MKVLANENLPGDAVEALRREGHDVIWVRTDMPGAQDPEILARSLIHDAQVFAAEAEVRWLGHVAARLAAQPRHAFALALASEKPRRGRPRAARTLGA